LPIIYFTVTNDLSYDQRMDRICNSLAQEGYNVCLIGRTTKKSIPLIHKAYQQKRLNCFFQKGKRFYIEYNFRLFFFLLFKKMDAICAIDLDTILPCFWIARLKKIEKIYDAHELFCEMKEIVSRPAVYKIWKSIERYTVPHFTHCYTVNQIIADEFQKMYGIKAEVIRSMALKKADNTNAKKERFILYQGAVNEGRCFETLIPAMKMVDSTLIICGDGNFMEQAQKLVIEHQLQEKVIFKGMLPPDELRHFTQSAYIGITLFDAEGKSNYYSLANRFFDYLHNGTPQICVNFPIYASMNNLHEIAVLVNDTETQTLANAINQLLHDETKWNRLHQQCAAAASVWNWQNEEKKLIGFYRNIFG